MTDNTFPVDIVGNSDRTQIGFHDDSGEHHSIVTAETNAVTGGINLLVGSASIPVTVDVGTFGAVGDGVALDSAAIALAVAAAGVNGVIQFDAGKTYLVDRAIKLLAGQTVVGYGATVKRLAQILTTTTDAITHNATTSIVLATGDGAKFSAGQTIALFNGVNYSSWNLTIGSVVGDTLNLTTSINVSAASPWSGSTVVALSFDVIKTATGCSVIGITVDGNKANYSKYHWELLTEIHTIDGYNTIDRCSLQNFPGEGIQENGASNFASVHNQYKNNTIINGNGNGIHLSGSAGVQVTGNYIYNTNLDGDIMGHNGGCITLSDGIKDCLIANNHLEQGRSGVGQIDSADNSFVSIVGNTVKNMTVFMLEIRGFNAAVTDVLISGNRFYNDTAPAAASLICVNIGDTSTNVFYRFTVTGNSFFNAGLLLNKLTDATVSGNDFYVTYQAADTYHTHISVTNVVNVTITGNTTHYGNTGISLNGSNVGVLVSGNGLYNAHYHGIYDSGGTNISLVGNNINMDTNVNSSADGVQTAGAGAVIKNNNIKLLAGYAGIRINGGANVIVQGNTVRASGANKTIRVETGSTGYVVAENQINYAITDVPSVGVRVANNDVIV